jgi:hypothetical protein
MIDLDNICRTGQINHLSSEYQLYIPTVSDLAGQHQMLDTFLNDVLLTYGMVRETDAKVQEQMRQHSWDRIVQRHNIERVGVPPGFSSILAESSAICTLCQNSLGDCANCMEPLEQCKCCTECNNGPDDCECTEECPLCNSVDCEADCVGSFLVKANNTIPVPIPVQIPNYSPSKNDKLVEAVTHNLESPGSCLFHRQCILTACNHSIGFIHCPNCRA